MTRSEIKMAAQAAYWKYVALCDEVDLVQYTPKGFYLSSVVDVLEYASVEFEEKDVDTILEYIEKHF